MNNSDLAISYAIFSAKQCGSTQVTPDHILLGCLTALSRFGIAVIAPWHIDLETLGVDWMHRPDGPRPKVAYSQEAVAIFNRAARIAKSNGDTNVGVSHLLAAFAAEGSGLMGDLKRIHGITSASWRAAVAQLGNGATPLERAKSTKKSERDYLTPEEAAEALGVHVQTMRAYIRDERLPAFRVAGERAIRILRTDLDKVLEPLKGEK